MFERCHKLFLHFFNLYRLQPSTLRKILIFYFKKLLRIKAERKEEALSDYFSTLISMNGRNSQETLDELTTHLSSGIDIILRKYPSSDLDAFYQVWSKREYQPVIDLMKMTVSSQDPITIIDAGGNVGCTALFFKKEFFNSRIIILESEISNFSLLERNIKLNKCQDMIVLNTGLWKNESYLEVQKDFRDKKEWSYYVKEVSYPTALKGIGALDLIKLYSLKGIDLFKIDIEGGEKHLFEDEKQASLFLSKTRYIAIEIHDELNVRNKIENCLKNNGFKFFTKGDLTIGRNMNFASPE